ncbi:hypothetical protein DNTS_030367 [Danionella cerebrum]|uniref:Glycosyltransferase 2-like domain-containing protein n=1 Tax=Danionella cerebrum TaxID=2873325 RepID=A0A553RH48_9TELE|nr:hypothetical protein DNTS_030367 [Danionella translucida]
MTRALTLVPYKHVAHKLAQGDLSEIDRVSGNRGLFGLVHLLQAEQQEFGGTKEITFLEGLLFFCRVQGLHHPFDAKICCCSKHSESHQHPNNFIPAEWAEQSIPRLIWQQFCQMLQRRCSDTSLNAWNGGQPENPRRWDLIARSIVPSSTRLDQLFCSGKSRVCGSRAFMAVARKIKTLLTVNILVFVGIILFSVYCRIQERSEELVQVGRLAEQRLRGRNAKVTNSMDRQSILKRLERLEDVVYNQLNGLKGELGLMPHQLVFVNSIPKLNLYVLLPSTAPPQSRASLAKPIGLLEGPGGLGQGGAAATLGEDSRETEGRFEEYGYNAQLSDRISLDRNIPDYRPKKCKQLSYPEDLPQLSVVFIFVNEALSVILRSVHSVVNHTPAHLLKEIILVDDNSDSAVSLLILSLCKIHPHILVASFSFAYLNFEVLYGLFCAADPKTTLL